MTSISKYPVSKKVQQRISEIFLQTIIKLQNESEVSQFLDEFLSPTEKVVLSKRMAIAVMLSKGYDYLTIRQVLKVTPPTIAKVAFWLKHRGVGYKKITEILIQDEKWQEFWAEVFHIVGKATVMRKGTNWSRNRRRVEEEYRNSQKAF